MYDIIYKTLRNAVNVKYYDHLVNPINFSAINDVSGCNNIETDTRNNSGIVLCSSDYTQRTSQPVSYFKEPNHNYALSKKTYDIDEYVNVFAKHEKLLSEKFDDNIKIIGQIFDTYIIVENGDVLYIFDQHAAAERVIYELYLAQMKYQIVGVQRMLIPENFDLSPSISELLKTSINLFNELGISIEEFGHNSFRITAYPSLLGSTSIGQIVKTIIADIEDDKNMEIEQKKDKIIRSACRASIKAGDNVSFIEAKKLVNDLFNCKHPFTCPHGRPTVYRIFQSELEKFFRRK
jgi:DNA mismatch repair protein MutL